MSTNLTYLAVLLVIGVLYGLTRPRKGSKPSSWVFKFFPQWGSNAREIQTRPVLGTADPVANPANPSEVAEILEEIYGDFTAETKRLESEMNQAVSDLRQETQENLAVISEEIKQLRRQVMTRQFEQSATPVHDSVDLTAAVMDSGNATNEIHMDSGRESEDTLSVREAAPAKEVRAGGVKSALHESVSNHEDADLKYFNILDALVRGSDPLLICEQLGVTIEQVQMVQRLMSFPLNSPQ